MEAQEGASDSADCQGASAPFSGSLEETAGEGAPTPVCEEDGKKPDLLTLLRVREQINQHLMEYNATINASEESIPDQVIDEKIIECSIEDLEKEMEAVKVSYQNKTLAIQRIQVTDALRTKLKNNDDDSKFIWDTIKHIMMLSTAILKSQQQSRELEEKLNKVKQSRLALKRAGECKLAQIHDTQRKQKEELENMEVSKMLKKVRRNLQQEIQMTTLIQNIFQVVKPHSPLIKFPDRKSTPKPKMQEPLQSRVPPLHAASSQFPAGGGPPSHQNISFSGRTQGTPDTSELVRTLPQKYRRKPIPVEEMDYIQRGGPE
ncbi:centromere protein H-like [Elgaria multicarinata webbii]|uniref:centromere protein H-like n=1 Tax=Elgaria multicarinata webbii TaxID=159646 RepID=UPI002FCCBB88